MNSAQRSGGFVLLWTLALLALAAVMLLELTHQSVRWATQAVDAQDALQRKWALSSCRRLLLENADEILCRQNAQTPEPPSWTLRVRQSLGGQELDVLIADEQCKVNVNALAHLEKHNLNRAIRNLLGTSSSFPLAPGLSTNALDSAPMRCWPELFPETPMAELVGDYSGMEKLTLWGNGRLNLRRASDQSVQTLLDTLLSRTEISRILQARSQSPDATLQEWLKSAELSGEVEKKVLQQVTDTSLCHSLLISIRCEPRVRFEQVILDRDNEGGDTTQPTTAPAKTAGRSGGMFRLTW